MPLALNTRIGRYEVRSMLGHGGMGEVYLAHDERLDRLVALKVLPSEVASNQQRMKRFMREARAVSALNHPNIVTIYELEKAGSTHLIVTELIEGETLRWHILHRRLDVSESLDIAIQLAGAVAAAHQCGIVHRDVKPENIMIRRDRVVKLLDFGLAKVTKRESANATGEEVTRSTFSTDPGSVVGSLYYMSPEQVRGLETDERTDIWGLGCVLYEMVTGRQPFTGATSADVIASIISSKPVSLANHAKGTLAKLEEIIEKALAKDRDERYQTVKGFLVDLRQMKKRLELEGHSQDGVTPEIAAWEQGNSATGHSPTNLTPGRASLVGREREIREICAQLLRQEVRLLTLTGVGGSGKTVLAYEAASQLRQEFADGVFMVELGSIMQPELVASAIAQPLGVQEAEGKPIIEALADHLRDTEILLVIDNFEQVSAAGSILAGLLATAPRVKILVTSRELLHLSVEREYMVPPLAVPESIAQASPDELMRYEAVRLFVERARGSKASFALTAQNAPIVAAICARLDGLPLAIELAAARVKLLSPEAILARLDDRMKLLTGGPRDLPARQQTMAAALEWSYDLLSRDEKQLFRRLAVFAGGFTLESAEAVCQGTSAEVDVLDLVTSLMDKSLLVAKDQQNGSMRFRMLEVVRDYATTRLQSDSEAESMLRNHAAHFLALAEVAEPHLQGAQPAEWLNRLEEEHDNIRGALRWLLAHDSAMATRLGAAIRYSWNFHGYFTEGLATAKEILRLGEVGPQGSRWKLLTMAGNMARFLGDYDNATEMYQTGLNEAIAANDWSQVSRSYRGLAGTALEKGDHIAAYTLIQRALAAARDSDDKFGIARSLNMFGDLERSRGEDAAARPFYEEALVICRQLENRYAIGNILNNLAASEFGGGDYAAARLHFAEGLEMSLAPDGKILGDKTAISYSLDGFAALAIRCGEPELSATLAGAAEYLRELMKIHTEPPERRFRDNYMPSLRAALAADRFQSAFDQGRNLKLEAVVALALRKVDS